MLRKVWMLAVCGLLPIISSCAHGSPDTPEPEPIPARVEVVNNNALPVEIYALGGGIERRLGTVHPGMSARFVIPMVIVNSTSVELEARPSTNSPRFKSGPLLLTPGAVVDIVLASRLFASTATIRP